MNINDLVRFWGRTRPSHAALLVGDETVTWAELDARSDAFARGLAAQGVGEGDRVGLLMHNSADLAALMLAVPKLGAITVPLNFRLIDKELAALLSDATPRVVVAGTELAGNLELALSEQAFSVFTTSPGEFPGVETLAVSSGPVPLVELSDDAPAFLCYTSGTTGRQKGALLTHRSILSVGQAQCVTHGITGADRVLGAAPLVFTGGCVSTFLQMVVYPGSTLVLMADFDPDRGLDAIVRHRVTAATLVPVLWEMIARLPEFGTIDVSTFAYAAAGGAPVPLDLLDTFRDRGIPLNQVYGLTEASGLTASLAYEDAAANPGFAGLPLVGTDLRIAAADGGFAGVDEVGEILVKGPHVMREYWGNPDATAATLEKGWLRTGDLGLQNERGFLKLVDRSKDMLISGGINVYPAEIERVLSGVPGVLELAVIGVPDDKWGEVPMVIVRADEAGAAVVDRLGEASRGNLARFKQPKHAVLITDPLPRTLSGKVAKPRLREAYLGVPADARPL